MGFGSSLKGYTKPISDFMFDQGGGNWDPDRSNFDLAGYQGMADQYGNMLQQGPRDAPQMGQSGFRGDQRGLANMLMDQSRGQGPGQEIARRQASQQVDRGVGQALSGARSARPGGSAMAARNAAMASGQLQGAGAQAASMGGLQAQQNAVGQLGAVLQSGRGQDQNRALQNARLQFDTMGMDDRRQMELLSQQLQMNRAQQQGGQAYEGALGQKYAQDAQKKSKFQQLAGAAQGIGQAYMNYQTGGLSGMAQNQMQNRGGQNTYGNPNYYGSGPQLQTGGGFSQSGGFGSGSAPSYGMGGGGLQNPYQDDPYSGRNSGFALPKL